jgi:pectate lyase
LSTDTYWKPSSVYTYTADSAASVKATVTAKAGAGKL